MVSSKEDTKISIIIPTLNEAAGIKKLIRYLHQHQAGFVREILVIDGGSHDETVELAKKSGAETFQSGGRGRSIQLSEGAKQAKGEILYFLHADTFPPKQFDVLIIDALKKKEWGRFNLQFDQNHWLLGIIGWLTKFNWSFYTFGDQSLYVKSDIYFSVGGYSKELEVFEDTDLGKKLADHSKGVVIKKPVTTSGRRFRENGTIRLTAVFIFLLISYLIGLSNRTLARYYKRMIR